MVFTPHPRFSWRLPARAPFPYRTRSLTTRWRIAAPPPPSLLGSTVGHINPSPSLPSCRTEEVAVPQQPYQNHSSCYLHLPSFLPWLVLHVWHLAVSRPLSGGLRLDGDPFLTWDATTRRSRSRIAVSPHRRPTHPDSAFRSPGKICGPLARTATMMGCRDRRGTRGVR